MTERLLEKISFWDAVINVLLALFVLLELGDIGWALFSLASGLILPLLASRFISDNDADDSVVNTALAVVVLLVFVTVLNIPVSMSNSLMESAAKVTEAQYLLCEDELDESSAVSVDKHNANVRACKNLLGDREGIIEEAVDSTRGLIDVYGKDVPPWKVTLLSILLSWFITLLMKIFFAIKELRN